jgi:hypothetical protein
MKPDKEAAPEWVTERITELLVEDPACNGRVTSWTVNAIAALPCYTPEQFAEIAKKSLEQWRVKDGYVPAYIAGSNAMLDKALEIVALVPGWISAALDEKVENTNHSSDAAHTGERIAALEVEVAMLRGALLSMGRMIPGVILDDRVSSQFLSQLPEELAHYSLARTALAQDHLHA